MVTRLRTEKTQILIGTSDFVRFHRPWTCIRVCTHNLPLLHGFFQFKLLILEDRFNFDCFNLFGWDITAKSKLGLHLICVLGIIINGWDSSGISLFQSHFFIDNDFLFEISYFLLFLFVWIIWLQFEAIQVLHLFFTLLIMVIQVFLRLKVLRCVGLMNFV